MVPGIAISVKRLLSGLKKTIEQQNKDLMAKSHQCIIPHTRNGYLKKRVSEWFSFVIRRYGTVSYVENWFG